jgi:hypothetical protein
MTYWVSYDQATNALLGVSDTALHDAPGAVVTQFEGDMPDMSRLAWNSATLSWYEKHRNVLTKREFLKKFTPTEYGNIKAACAANATVDYFWQLFTLAEEVNMSDPDTAGGIGLLEQAGLIGAGRAAEILA